MDQQNKLLAMLKSATTIPSSSSPSQSQGSDISSHTSSREHQQSQSQPQPQSTSQYLIPPNLGSPREPSPSPPPPSLQAVSLQDLFKNISSPPPPAAPVTSSTGLPSVTSPTPFDQKNKLLGMLSIIVQPTPSSTGIITPPSVSGVSTTPTTQEKGDLLSIFKTNHPDTVPSSPTGQGPVINHLTGFSSPSSANPVEAQRTGNSTNSSQAKSSIVEEKISTPSTKADETPKKSIFHFDSPFDAFTQPPRSRQTSSAQLPKPQSSIVSTPKDIKPRLDDEHDLSRVKSIDKLANKGRGSPLKSSQTDQKPYEPPKTITQEVSVHELPQNEIDEKLKDTWQIGKIVKDEQGKGPKALTTHTTIDLSKPNLDSLVNTGNTVQVVPTTLMRTDSLSYRKGRRVGITNTYIAYTMSKGRVRLIDSSSGARLVIQLPSTASCGPVIDLAVTSNYVATIGWDKAIVVHRVPQDWKKDDPKIEIVLFCLGVFGPLGSPSKIEWVKKDGLDWLAVAGSKGVVLINPAVHGKGGEVISMEDICKEVKMLKTDGSVVDFCLNHSHQAIGLLSSTSYCTLYNVANLNRVWHRCLPTKSLTAEPSSMQFCESNILVGRANNTHYDLVQITVDLAVLSTIKFIAPSPCPENLNYTQAVYDTARSALYIAPFARGSIYAFKYALKGQQPIKNVSIPDGSKVVAFDKVAEYPLEPVLSLVLAKKGVDKDSEILFATAQGFSQASISREAYNALKASNTHQVQEGSVPPPAPAVPAAPAAPAKTAPVSKSPNGKVDAPKVKSVTAPKIPSNKPSPAIVKTELPSASEDEAAIQARPKVQSRKGSIAPATIADADENNAVVFNQEELNKSLKKTEDRLSNHLKQLIKNEITALNVRLDGLTGPDFAADISTRIERQVKASLSNTITQEIKRSLIPAATASIQQEIRTVTSNQVPAAIFDALQTVPKELEKGLTPVVQKTIANLVQNAMDKTVQEGIQHTLLPAMTQASTSIVEQLSSDLRSEMLQIRKELSPPSNEGQLANDQLLKSMAASIAELQKQVLTLSEHIKSAPTAPTPSAHAPGPNGALSPSVPAVFPTTSSAPPPLPPQPPVGLSVPSASHLEDTFLSALGAQNTSSTLRLVADHLAITEYCLPNQGKSPLSQAVLLTLLHRLAIVLSEIQSTHSMFAQVVGWERRTALLVDPKDQNIASYISRVLSVVQSQLTMVMNNLQKHPEPNTQSHMVAVSNIMEVLRQKIAF
ncbi:uncharacterized protein IL334_007036 [Kwoniella shivajii]|uniref:Enhancer of mRNA-decapping protein 4 WD40 repeat region domain-containing protein n=1 Tax=Kwoniella shivajii TaxID=564305 RepID=A0ABZ1D7M1_9TREE|nr:hypothetical protein IL334_007036 [Kwoniella shivajii]